MSKSNDSEMMDERGVEREAYSKEAPSKSPVVHALEIMRAGIVATSLTALAGKIIATTTAVNLPSASLQTMTMTNTRSAVLRQRSRARTTTASMLVGCLGPVSKIKR